MCSFALRKEQPTRDLPGFQHRAALIFTIRILSLGAGLYHKVGTTGAGSDPPLPWISVLAPEGAAPLPN